MIVFFLSTAHPQFMANSSLYIQGLGALIQVKLGNKVDTKYFYRSLCILMTEVSQDYLQDSSFSLGLFIFQESPVFHANTLRFRLACFPNGTHLKLVMRLGNLKICLIMTIS